MTNQECKTHEHQILDLKTRSVENNVIINGIEEKSIEGSNGPSQDSENGVYNGSWDARRECEQYK